VSWSVSGTSPSSSDWVGLYVIGAPSTDYLWWTYTAGQPTGQKTVTMPSAPGTYEFRYLLDNGYTVVATSNPVTVGGSPAPTLTFTATPATIAPGQSSTLSWTTTNATSCTASGGWSGTKPTSGSQVVSPASTTTYTLNCQGPGGSVVESVTVTVSSGGGPTYTLTASPTSVGPGGSVTV